MRFISVVTFVPAVLLLIGAASAPGADWPTYQHDFKRSGGTEEQLALPLAVKWQFQPRYAPNPAWSDDPSVINPYSGRWGRQRGLYANILDFDFAFHPVEAGGSVYFGSSADHRVFCLDAASGAVRWTFSTEGAVRMAPSVWENKVYAGSDDGYVYCLAADGGKLLW